MDDVTTEEIMSSLAGRAIGISKQFIDDTVKLAQCTPTHIPKELGWAVARVKAYLFRRQEDLRGVLLGILAELGIEPFAARTSTLLGKAVKEVEQKGTYPILPLRTEQVAWQVVGENIGIIHIFSARLIRRFPYIPYPQIFSLTSVEAHRCALFCDPEIRTFATYMGDGRYRYVAKLLERQDQLVALSDRRMNQLSVLRRLEREHQGIDDHDLVRLMGVPEEIIQRLRADAMLSRTRTLGYDDCDVSSEGTNGSTPRVSAIDNLSIGDAVDFGKITKIMMEILSERELQVLCMRLGFDSGGKEMKQPEVARELGITKTRVGQIEIRVVKKIQGRLRLRQTGTSLTARKRVAVR